MAGGVDGGGRVARGHRLAGVRQRSVALALVAASAVALAGCHIEKVPVTWDDAIPAPTEQELADDFRRVECEAGLSDEYPVFLDTANDRLHIFINEPSIDWVRVFDEFGTLVNAYPVSYGTPGEGVHFHRVLSPGTYLVDWVDGPWNAALSEMRCPAYGPLYVG